MGDTVAYPRWVSEGFGRRQPGNIVSMGLLDRLRGTDDRAPAGAPRGRTKLMRDAVAMRDALDAVQREAGGRTVLLDLRAVVRELLDGEIAAPTADVASLVSRGTDPADFYERELSPSW